MPPPYPRALRSLARIALRQTTTTLSTTHSIPPTRSISITSTAAAAAARGATRPSPRRRRQQLANGSLGQNVELPRDMSVDEVLPPVAYLKSAQKAGALDMVPERARSVVALYFKASRELKTGDWERDFLAGKKRRVSFYHVSMSLTTARPSHEPSSARPNNVPFNAR